MAKATSNNVDDFTSPTAPTLWNVMVRHSPFLLKRADIEANSADEAKGKFIELVRAKHEARERRVPEQRGLDAQTVAESQKAIRDAFARGIAARDQLEWCVRPADEVKKQREAIVAEQKLSLAGAAK